MFFHILSIYRLTSQKYIKKTQKYQPCGLYTDFFKDKKMYIPDIKLDTKFLVQTFLMSDNVSNGIFRLFLTSDFRVLFQKLHPIYSITQLFGFMFFL